MRLLELVAGELDSRSDLTRRFRGPLPKSSLEFLDIEDIARSVNRPIPRIADLVDLPANGRLFPALRPLRAIAG